MVHRSLLKRWLGWAIVTVVLVRVFPSLLRTVFGGLLRYRGIPLLIAIMFGLVVYGLYRRRR